MATEIMKVGGYSRSNVGYLSKVYLLKVREVVMVVDGWRNKLVGAAGRMVRNGDILLKDGVVGYELRFPPRVGQMRVVERENGSVVAYECSVLGDVPGVQLDVFQLDDENRLAEWMLIVIDNNGQSWLLGNEERGLTMRVNQAVAGDNVLTVEFSGLLNVPAMTLQSTELGVVFPDSAFSTEFSRDFLA